MEMCMPSKNAKRVTVGHPPGYIIYEINNIM